LLVVEVEAVLRAMLIMAVVAVELVDYCKVLLVFLHLLRIQLL
jgi:hypothetical protein